MATASVWTRRRRRKARAVMPAEVVDEISVPRSKRRSPNTAMKTFPCSHSGCTTRTRRIPPTKRRSWRKRSRPSRRSRSRNWLAITVSLASRGSGRPAPTWNCSTSFKTRVGAPRAVEDPGVSLRTVPVHTPDQELCDDLGVLLYQDTPGGAGESFRLPTQGKTAGREQPLESPSHHYVRFPTHRKGQGVVVTEFAGEGTAPPHWDGTEAPRPPRSAGPRVHPDRRHPNLRRVDPQGSTACSPRTCP